MINGLFSSSSLLVYIDAYTQFFVQILLIKIGLGHVKFHKVLLYISIPFVFDVIPIDVGKPSVLLDICDPVFGPQTEFRVLLQKAFDEIEAVP